MSNEKQYTDDDYLFNAAIKLSKTRRIENERLKSEIKTLKPLHKKEINKVKSELYRYMAVLSMMVELKDHKDEFGKDAKYIEHMPVAWKSARNLVKSDECKSLVSEDKQMKSDFAQISSLLKNVTDVNEWTELEINEAEGIASKYSEG